MKIPNFSLYQSLPKFSDQGKLDFDVDLEQKVEQFIKAAPEMAGSLKLLHPNLRRSIIDSSFGDAVDETPDPDSIASISTTLKELSGGAKVQTVGIWDLDTTIGDLPRLVAELNTAQPKFAFFHVHASVPATLVTPGLELASFLKQDAALKDNLMADYFYPIARKTRKDFGLDFLVGITRHMIAFTENGALHYNYFSVSEEAEPLVSSYGMRGYAKEAGKPFRAAVGFLIIAQLLEMVNPKIGFHRENKGCLFDFNESRDSIVEGLKSFRIDDDCMRKIEAEYRAAAEGFLAALNLIGTSQ